MQNKFDISKDEGKNATAKNRVKDRIFAGSFALVFPTIWKQKFIFPRFHANLSKILTYFPIINEYFFDKSHLNLHS